MTQPAPTAAREQIIDTMIELRRLSNSHRVIVAGGSIEVTYLALHRRGFFRVTTTGICGVPCGRYSVGLIAGQNSVPPSLRSRRS
jgi:hypothetical protein